MDKEVARDRRRGLKAIGCGCCAGLLVVCAVSALALFVGAKCLVSFGIASSLGGYIRAVEQADVAPETQEDLLDRLERLRARAQRGDRVGFLSWLSHDEALQSLIERGLTTDRDIAAFKRELDRIEDEIDPEPEEQPRVEPPEAPDAPLVRAE